MKNRGFALASLAFGVLMIAGSEASRAGTNGPYQFHAVTPCREFDTRDAGGPTSGAPLNQGTVYKFKLQETCGIPLGAKAVTVNATIVGPTKTGFLSLWPNGVTFPVVGTLNFNAGEPALANGAIVPVADPTVPANANKDLNVVVGMQSAGTAHLVMDVTGYFQ